VLIEIGLMIQIVMMIEIGLILNHRGGSPGAQEPVLGVDAG
jgi:hypothetical protein